MNPTQHVTTSDVHPPTTVVTAPAGAADSPGTEIVKVKKPKKPKLTKAEKKALKLEKKRLRLLKIENQKKTFFYEALTRELKYTKLSYARGDLDREQSCLEVEYPKAKLDLNNAFQNLNRMLDIKDHTINRLKQDRQTADEQYRRNAHKHMDIIEYLIKLFKLFVNVFKENYESIAYEMIKDFHIEIRNKERIFDRRKSYYDSLLFATNSLSIFYLENHKREFMVNKQEKEEHKSLMVDTLHQSMLALRNQMIRMMRELTASKVPPNRLKVYDILLQKKNHAEDQFKKMAIDKRKREKVITSLKVELSAMELKYTKNLSDLRHEKRVFKVNFEILKTKYDKDLINDQSQMRVLASSSFEPLKQLAKLEKFGERIIGVASVTRKYETEKEKVTPFSESVENEPADTDETIENIHLLQNFMYKVSKVEYTNRRLVEERDALTRENECARECLRRYCHEQTYNLIIGSLRLNNSPTSVPIPTQEASQMVQITNLNLKK